ncbi:MAG TPA: hypothetical protein VFV66_32795 [Nonomuraea sp.]|nr:hypothetical protein [Nonomuraea sp.]
MLAISLGVAWLLLAPLSLWLLFRGTAAERVGAVVTLALLEAGTIALQQLAPEPAAPAAAVMSHEVRPACDARTPALRSAKVGRSLVLSWAAAGHECETAEVTVRTKGKRLLVRLRTGAGPVPVRVEGDTAAVTVPLPERSGHVPIDAGSGRRIPAALRR